MTYTSNIKPISFFFLALLLISLLTVPALGAVGGSCGSGLTWTLDGAALTVSGQGAMTDFTDAEMPPWYPYAGSITSVTVEEGVTSLGSLSFFGCSALMDLSLPASLTAIGDRACRDCTSLAYVSVPQGVSAIGRSAFEGCTALAAVDLPEGLLSLGDMAFYRCAALRSVTVPSTVQDMGMVVFGHCASLLRADIRCPISRLPDMTFFGCTSLAEVALPRELTQVGNDAFEACRSLSGVYYSGQEADAIARDIEADTALSARGGLIEEPMESNLAHTVEESTSLRTVTDTAAALITVERPVENGVPAAIGTVTAVLKNGAGWREVASAVSQMILDRTQRGGSGAITVTVEAPGIPLDGGVMADFIGESVSLHIHAGGGVRWHIDMSALRHGDMAPQQYHLTASLSQQQDKPEQVVCARLYRLDTLPDVDFPATVGLPLGEDTARRYASLFTADGKKYALQSSVVVDADGVAWFPVSGGWDAFACYVALDAEGVWLENASVPATLHDEYGASEGMLTDAQGNRYKITGRSSRWGITGGRFALYVGAAMLGVVLVVTIIMVSRNQIIKGREAGRAAAERAAIARTRKEGETDSHSREES